MAEKKYESVRNNLQYQANELSQDLIVAKLDASQLLNSKHEISVKIEELKKLEQDQMKNLDLLQRKNEYLAGAFDLLKTKKTSLIEKKQKIEDEKSRVTNEESNYEVKLRTLQQQVEVVKNEKGKLEKIQRELVSNRKLIQKELSSIKIKAKKRKMLIRKIKKRRLSPNQKKQELENLKNEYSQSFQKLMAKITELEDLKKQNNEHAKEFDLMKENADFENTKVNEKIMLLNKKEEILKNRHNDYTFKERICGCMIADVPSELDLMKLAPVELNYSLQNNLMNDRMIDMKRMGFGFPGNVGYQQRF